MASALALLPGQVTAPLPASELGCACVAVPDTWLLCRTTGTEGSQQDCCTLSCQWAILDFEKREGFCAKERVLAVTAMIRSITAMYEDGAASVSSACRDDLLCEHVHAMK